MSDSNSLLLQVLSELGEVQRQVGISQGQNTHIISELGRASDSRRALHGKLDLQRDGLADLAMRIGSAETRIDMLEPKVTEFSEAHRDRRAVSRFFRSKYTLGVGVLGSGVAGWHQWEKITSMASRIFK